MTSDYLKDFFKKLDTLPELLDVNHLVELGLYTHKNIAYRARVKGIGPNYIKMPGKVLYPKESLRDFIVKRFYDGSQPKEMQINGIHEK